MTIYIDLVFLLNLFFDFSLLLTVNNTLKRNVALKKIFAGSLVGSLSFFTLFFSLNSVLLMILKFVMAFLMVIVTFGLKDKKYTIQNLSYLYMTSTVLGGFLYFLNLSFSESNNGLIFSYNKISINYVFLVIFSPIMLYIYKKEKIEMQEYDEYYTVKIVLKNKVTLNLVAYLDTGNKLRDPVTKKRVIIVNEKALPKININYFYVPYNTLNGSGLIKCMPINYIQIGNKKSHNYLIGISEGKLLRDGVDCVLNKYCKEELL